MVTAEAIFNTAFTLGLMILFSMFVEWFVGTYILKRHVIGWIAKGIGALLGLALVVFALTRQGADTAASGADPAQVGNILGLVFGVGLAVLFVIVYITLFMSRRIGPLALAINVAALFGVSIVAYLVLRPLIPVEELADNDIIFLCVAAALGVIALGNLLMRPALAEHRTGTQLPINTQVDALSFGEKRRQRLNKRRARR